MPFTKHREGNKYILYKSSLTPLLGTSKQFEESCLKKGLIRDQRTNCLHSCLLNEHSFLTNLCTGELSNAVYLHKRECLYTLTRLQGKTPTCMNLILLPQEFQQGAPRFDHEPAGAYRQWTAHDTGSLPSSQLLFYTEKSWKTDNTFPCNPLQRSRLTQRFQQDNILQCEPHY